MAERITRYTTETGAGEPPDGSRGFLVDNQTGASIRAQLAVTGGSWNGSKHAEAGTLSDPGTDGYEVFNGKVDARGVISYAGADLVMTFSGLDRRLSYEVIVFGNRGNSSYNDRLSQTKIRGAESFKKREFHGGRFCG